MTIDAVTIALIISAGNFLLTILSQRNSIKKDTLGELRAECEDLRRRIQQLEIEQQRCEEDRKRLVNENTSQRSELFKLYQRIYNNER